MEDVLVSIVVPVYNMEANIADCVHSLIGQTYSNIEIILVDDGSKDNSLKIIKILADKDSRIKHYHTENQGSGPARNFGIAHAKGKYIYFPDADDILEPSAIELLVRNIETSNADLIVFGYRSIDVAGNVVFEKKYSNFVVYGSEIRKDYSNYYYMDRPYSIQGAPWNKLFKREVIEKFDVQYPKLRRHQDDAFIARYISYCSTIQFLDAVLYTYYVNDWKKTWDKYPVTYLDSVIGLYEDRKNTILTWSLNDLQTHDMVVNEYICNVIKGLELSFSSKYNFKNRKERLQWIEDNIERCELKAISCPDMTSKYQKYVFSKIIAGKIGIVYRILWFKVKCEKSGLLSLVRR